MPDYRLTRYDFSGCKVIVTGGSGGIGGAFARGFRDAGAAVTITGTRDSAADYPDEDLARMRYLRLDTRDGAAILKLASEFDTLDVLINCAGNARPGGKSEADPDIFAQTIDINLVGTYRFCQAFRDALSAAGGSIINVASMSAYASLPGVPGYGASKAGIVQLTMALAESYAPKGIRVNGIAPGWIRSKMTNPIEADDQSSTAILKHTPMARWGEPDDMAGPALFLASDAAGFVTGVTLPVDGGYNAVM